MAKEIRTFRFGDGKTVEKEGTKTVREPVVEKKTTVKKTSSSAPKTEVKRATLYNPENGSPKVVEVGSTEASDLQSKGWTLTKGQVTQPVVPQSTEVKKATLYNPQDGTARVVVIGSTEASSLQSQGWTLTKGAITQPSPVDPLKPTAPIKPVDAVLPTPQAEAKQATLYGPNGVAKVVTVGSPEASQLQSQGYTLQKPLDQPIQPGQPGQQVQQPGVDGFVPPAGYEAVPHPSMIKNYTAHITSPDGKTIYGRPVTGAEGEGVVDTSITSETAGLLGETGASLTDFERVSRGIDPITDEILQQVYTDLGIPELANSAFGKPQVTTVETYNTAYEDAKLGDLKIKIEGKLAELNTKKQELNEKLEKLGDNPWLSEASLRGRTKRAQEVASGAIDNLNDEIKNMSELYNSGTKEISDMVTRTTSDFQTDATMNTAKLNYLLKQAEVKLGVKKDENLAKAYEKLPEYLKAAADASGTADYGYFGSATTGNYIYNKGTGDWEQVSAPKATSTGGTKTAKKTATQILSEQAGEMTNALSLVKGADGFVSPADYSTAKRSWVSKTGKDGSDFDKRFSIFRNPGNFDYNLD